MSRGIVTIYKTFTLQEWDYQRRFFQRRNDKITDAVEEILNKHPNPARIHTENVF